MPENDPLFRHAEYLDRLHKAQHSAAVSKTPSDPLLDELANRYDHYAETMESEDRILHALSTQLRVAAKNGVDQTEMYETLTNVGLSLSHHEFIRFLDGLRRERRAPHTAASGRTRHKDNQTESRQVRPVRGPTPLTATEWALVLAPALRGAPHAPHYEAICTALRPWGIKLGANTLRRAHLALPAPSKRDAPPPWHRVLDQMELQLVVMARLGCSPREIAALLKGRHLNAPESEIATWLARTLEKPGHHSTTRAIRNLDRLPDESDEATGHRITVTIDPVLMPAFRVTVDGPDDPKAVAFIRQWLDAGARALSDQLPPTPPTGTAPRKKRR